MTLQEILITLTENKYSILYIKIIEKALKENRTKLKKDNPFYIYYESHHILPKSIFKEYSSFKHNPWNKVLLTPKEHFICHISIMFHYRKIKDKNRYMKMSKAINMMSNTRKNNSRVYGNYKLNLSHSEETIEKLKESWTPKRKANANKNRKGNIVYTDEGRLACAKGQTGRKHSEESNTKKSNSLKGRIFSEEHKENLSKAQKGKKRSAEAVIKGIKTRKENYLIPDENGRTPRDKRKEISLGSNNSNAKHIILYDELGNIQYSMKGNLGVVCKENKLPLRLIRESFSNNSIIKITSRNSKRGLYNSFEGWYARVIL